MVSTDVQTTLSVPADKLPFVRWAVNEVFRGMATMLRDQWVEAIGSNAKAALETLIQNEDRLAVFAGLYFQIATTQREIVARAHSIELRTTTQAAQALLEEVVRGVIPMAQQRIGAELLDEARITEIDNLRAVETWALAELDGIRAIMEEWAETA